jgi:hypothetical protein
MREVAIVLGIGAATMFAVLFIAAPLLYYWDRWMLRSKTVIGKESSPPDRS